MTSNRAKRAAEEQLQYADPLIGAYPGSKLDMN